MHLSIRHALDMHQLQALRSVLSKHHADQFGVCGVVFDEKKLRQHVLDHSACRCRGKPIMISGIYRPLLAAARDRPPACYGNP
jgi:hypothetical protein